MPSKKDACSKCGKLKDKRSKHCSDCTEIRTTAAEHGDVKRYWAGCRCAGCKQANALRAADKFRQNPDARRVRDKLWRDRNKQQINNKQQKINQTVKLIAATKARRKLHTQGVLIDYIVDEPKTKYLVYALVDPRTIAVRYVGVSSNGLSRPKTHGLPSALALGINKRKDDWIAGLQAVGLNYAIRVLQYFDNPHTAHKAEFWWIQWMRDQGEHLYNLTTGDDAQVIVSEETREKMRAIMAGRKITWGDKISKAKQGKHFGGRVARQYTLGDQTLTLQEWAKQSGIAVVTIRGRLTLGWSVEQAINTPTTSCSSHNLRRFAFDDKYLTITQWAKHLNISQATLYSRIHQQGWPLEKALTTPTRKCRVA